MRSMPILSSQVLIHTAIDTYRDQDPEGEGGVDLRRDNDDREFKKFNNFIKSGAADAGTEEKNPDLKWGLKWNRENILPQMQW